MIYIKLRNLSFGEKGYVKILQENSSYLNYDFIKIERDSVKDLVFKRLKMIAKEFETKEQLDLRSGKEEYNTEKLYFEDYLNRVFLTFLINTGFFSIFVGFGSWVAEVLGLNKS